MITTHRDGNRLRRTRAKGAHTAGAYPGFCSMKQLRVLLLPQQYVTGTPAVTVSSSHWHPTPAAYCFTPSTMSLAPIYTPGWRGTMWGIVSCLRKQHHGRDWASKQRPSDLKSNELTTTSLCPHKTVITTSYSARASEIIVFLNSKLR